MGEIDMKEIKVGEYVRTKQGYIAKLEKITDEFMWFDNVIYIDYEETNGLHLTEKYGVYNQIKDIVKYSPKIIDLVGVGDYVNGHLVFDIAQVPTKAIYIEDNQNKMAHIPYTNKDIKTIVTKEQFESIKYEV